MPREITRCAPTPALPGPARPPQATSSGLEGVIACDTALSRVEGTRGRLTIAGRSVEALAGAAPFERVASDLWHLALGASPAETDTVPVVRRALGEARLRAFSRLGSLGAALDRDDAMAALRAAVAGLDARAPGTERSTAASAPPWTPISSPWRITDSTHRPLRPAS